jgi:hypothetical protein
MTTLALPLFLLGLLSLIGTLVTLAVAPLTPRATVPVCCRRRMDAFLAWGRVTLAASVGLTAVGAALLLVAAL